MTLPDTRTFITSLISFLPSTTSTPNPLKHASQSQKSTLLALHILFPNELLSALDLLDRDLITRFTLKPSSTTTGQGIKETTPTTTEATDTERTSARANKAKVYYVRSAQQGNPRYRDTVSSTHYEVRMEAWSCSCPAFVFSAFPAAGTSQSQYAPVQPQQLSTQPLAQQPEDQPRQQDQENIDPAHTTQEQESREWKVGGLSLGADIPICKHLLACVLVEHGGCFGNYVREEEVSMEEMVGWAAGWGG